MSDTVSDINTVNIALSQVVLLLAPIARIGLTGQGTVSSHRVISDAKQAIEILKHIQHLYYQYWEHSFNKTNPADPQNLEDDTVMFGPSSISAMSFLKEAISAAQSSSTQSLPSPTQAIYLATETIITSLIKPFVLTQDAKAAGAVLDGYEGPSQKAS